MKMTVNGYEIEGSPQEIQQYLDLIAKKPASPPTPPAASASRNFRIDGKPNIKENHLAQFFDLTATQRETYKAISAFEPIHVSGLKEILDIGVNAAGQRVDTLVRLGLVVRIAPGHYKLAD